MSFFENLIFPNRLNFGSVFGPGYYTEFTESKSGDIQQVQRWGEARRILEATQVIKDPTKIGELLTFYHIVGGGANGFRVLDLSDHSSAALHKLPGYGPGPVAATRNDQIIGTGDGTTTVFQLVKRYTSGAYERVRNIRKPISGTVLIALNGVLQTEITHYQIDYTTGIVTFATAPGAGVLITAGYNFHVPCCFSPQTDRQLRIAIDNWAVSSIQGPCELMELLNPTAVADELPLGGAVSIVAGSTYLWSPPQGHAIRLAPTAAHDLLIPAAPSLPGSYHAYFENTSGTHTVTVKAAGTTQFTLAAGVKRTAVVMKNSSSVNVWTAF